MRLAAHGADHGINEAGQLFQPVYSFLGAETPATVASNHFRDTTSVPVLTPSNDVTRSLYVPTAGAVHWKPAKYAL